MLTSSFSCNLIYSRFISNDFGGGYSQTVGGTLSNSVTEASCALNTPGAAAAVNAGK